MTATETWTIGRLLTWTTEYLQQHGSESARLDSEILLAHARECQRIELYAAFDEEPTDEVKTAFREMVRRRAEGTPVAYLVGFKEFYSLNFEVNPDVLIPRPETEHLVLEAIDRSKERGNSEPLQIADVGTGSGIIAITLAKNIPNSRITAIDKSPQALEVSRRNAERNGINESQIHFVESDLLAACDPDSRFDLIVSNPPYVSESEYEQLDQSVREHEPKMALVSGPGGHEAIVELLQQARNSLTEKGLVLIELSPMLAKNSSEWLPNGWQIVKTTKDLAGLPRVLTFRQSQ